MRILITGANGMLAKAVIEELKNEELICTDVKELDITQLSKVDEFVKESKPEFIINCAAYTAVDKAEEQEELAEKINAEGPKNLAIVANKYGVVLVHISTDYVFSGNKNINESYTEDEEKEPVTVYGKTKLNGEKNIQNECSKYYIFRTAWLYGNGNNFVRTMLKLGKEKEEINVVYDQHGSPTYACDLAKIIHNAIKKEIPYGVYHATNEGYTCWYEFTKKIFEIANISCKVNPVTSNEYKTLAKRPLNSKLSKEKIKNEGIEIPSYENALKRYLDLERNDENNEES